MTARTVGRLRAGVLLVALVAGLAACESGASGPQYAFRIDYQQVPAGGGTPSADELEATRQIIEQRLDSTGIAAFKDLGRLIALLRSGPLPHPLREVPPG
jgi:hypothetical protein